MQTTIRTIRADIGRYRHAIDTNTDDVHLQRHTLATGWTNLIRYDCNCNAWAADTGQLIGRFRTEEQHWVFTCARTGHRIIGRHERFAEGLLDTEVDVSKWWLAQQHNTPT